MKVLTLKQLFAGTLLVILLSAAAGIAQTSGRKLDSFRKFVTRLPDIDKLEIVEVKPVLTDDLAQLQCNRGGLICAPDNFPYQPGSKRTLVGAEAKKFVRVWRSLTLDRLAPRSKCLTPDYVLRFFKADNLILETQVCALCHKITLPTVGVVSVEGSKKYPYYNLQDALLPDRELRRRWQSFKEKMMLRAGKQLSLVGLITGKAVLSIEYDDWDVYLSGVDLEQVNILNNLACHTAVKVTGILQYYSAPNTGNSPIAQQRPPDHFYFDRPQIEVVRTNGRYARSRP
jgi:hypothetical protein